MHCCIVVCHMPICWWSLRCFLYQLMNTGMSQICTGRNYKWNYLIVCSLPRIFDIRFHTAVLLEQKRQWRTRSLNTKSFSQFLWICVFSLGSGCGSFTWQENAVNYPTNCVFRLTTSFRVVSSWCMRKSCVLWFNRPNTFLINFLFVCRFGVRAEFTKEIVKPALGVSGVGGSMALYGVFGAIVSSLIW